MDEIDLKDVPFAGWLEEAIPALCRMDVKCIGVAAILKDGGIATNFWEADTNAGWLEEAIPALCRMDVKCIGMAAILKDGCIATNFWEADTNDMAAMGYRFMEEGVLNTLRANGRELKEIIDNAEREENGEGIEP